MILAASDALEQARAAKRGGAPVIGYLGAAAPIELIDAAGCFPVIVAPDLAPVSPRALRYMEPELGQATCSVFDRVLGGAFDFIDLLVVPTISDPACDVFQYLKELTRLGEADAIPPLAVHDLPQGRGAAVKAYGLARTRELARRLALVPGARLDEPSLARALADGNRRRRALRSLHRARLARRVNGVAAHRLIAAGFTLRPAGHAAMLEQAIARLPAGAALSGPRALIVPGEPMFHDGLHRAIEAAGALVVAEDDGWGTRAGGPDFVTTGDPIAALVERYHRDWPGLRAPIESRLAWLDDFLAQGGIDLVIFAIPEDDHGFGWSYPAMKETAERCAIKTVLTREDARDAPSAARLTAALRQAIGAR